MAADLTLVLEECLDRLAQGDTIQACLAYFPDQACELKPLLSAAVRLDRAMQVQPSAGFKARTRTRLFAHMQAHPRGGARPALRVAVAPQGVRRLSPLSQLMLGLSVLSLAFAVTGTALAQSALPNASLYPWKLASEQLWRSLSLDRAGVDLALADRRLDEFLALSGDTAAQSVAMHGYREVMLNLAQDKLPSDQPRIDTTLKTQQTKLKNLGIPIVLPAPSAGSDAKKSPAQGLPSGRHLPAPTLPSIKAPF